jgi:hypothetical protein
MSGDNVNFVSHLKVFADRDRRLHGGQIRIAAHDDADEWGCHRVLYSTYTSAEYPATANRRNAEVDCET